MPPEILEPLMEARELWRRKDWLTTPRVMGEVALGGCGIDEALDDMLAYNQALADFERVFNEND